MEPDIFANELVGKPGGILISDTINGEPIVLLGKSNIPKRANEYEGFGGKWEPEDISSLHTALREMIEEFFNCKVSTKFINQLAIQMVNSPHILKRTELNGMSYLINLVGLEFIFAQLTGSGESGTSELAQYKTQSNRFDYQTYITNRVITEIPSNGINEINSIHICKLSDIKNRIYDLRWFTSKIIYEMLIKPSKNKQIIL